jgi:trigger factor
LYKGLTLKFEKEILDDQQAKITVELDSSVLEDYKARAARKISSKTKIAGFRPGKAPFEVIKRLYGDESIEEEAIELMINEIYPKLLKEADVSPAAQGKLEKIESKNPPKFTFIIPLEPEVILGDYHSIRTAFSPEQASEEDVKKVLHQLQLNYSTAATAEREARQGDLVDLKMSASIINPEKDENAEVLKESPYQLILGEDNSGEDTFPFSGFEEHVYGLKQSEEGVFNHKYADKSPFEKLKGKEVQFKVLVQGIRELKKPELNDEFAKNLGNDKSFADFKKAIENDINASKLHEYEHKYMDDLIDKIVSGSQIKYPPQILDEEKHRVLDNFEQNLSSQNMDLDTYLKMNQIDKEKFIKEDIAAAAKRQLEQYLVLEELRKAEKIELEKDELQKEYSKSFSEIQANTDIQKLRRQFTAKGLANRVLMQAANRLINQRVEERLKEIATGSFHTTSENKEINDSPKQEKQQKESEG